MYLPIKKFIPLFVILLTCAFQSNGQIITTNLGSIEKLCPNSADGHLKAGNHHFDGKVNARVRFTPYLTEDRKQLRVKIFLSEKAVQRTTKIEAEFDKNLFTATKGKKINAYFWNGKKRFYYHNSIRSDDFQQILPEGGGEVIGCNDGDQYEMVKNGKTIRSIKIIGDTGSVDISTDRNCDCDSKIQRIDFNNIKIFLEDESRPNDIDQCNALINKWKGHTISGNAFTWNKNVNSFERSSGNNCEYDNRLKWSIEKGNREGVYFLKNITSGKYLSASGTNETKLVSKKVAESSWKFTVAKDFPGYYHIINESTGGALHVEYGKFQLDRNMTKGQWSSKWKLGSCYCTVLI